MAPYRSRSALLAGACLLVLGACGERLDPDIRSWGRGFDTSDAALAAVGPRPSPDGRGVLSYPTYQVAVAQRGDTVATLAGRVGLPAEEVARYNGLPVNAPLRADEVVALPSRVAAGPAAGPVSTGSVSGAAADAIDVTTLAGDAINRSTDTTPPATPVALPGGREPIRHQVARGETAYSVARRYGVSVRSLAEWNGLGADLAVREGQYLLIPIASTPPPVTVTTAPGTGSPTPVPPSAAEPLPAETATAAPPAVPPSPDLGEQRSAASDTARLLTPVVGSVIRPYDKGKNDGIAIAAAAGTPVKAADAGTVAAITRDTEGVPIVVLRHGGNLLTVYAGVEGVTVEKGATVSRGQTIATVRGGDPSFLHFEVREGFESVDPDIYLN